MDARLEAYLDGELPSAERRRFEQHLRERPAWEDALARARRLRTELRALPAPACPPHVTRAVLARTRSRPDRAPRSRRAHRRGRPWRSALAAAALFAAVALAPLVSPPPAPSEHPAYTRAEIQQAAAEVRWTLAYVAHVTQEAGQTVRRDVLEAHVVEPMQDAFAPFISPSPSDS